MYEDYNPVPIDTSGIVLSDDLQKLISRIALNQHEIRSKEFIDAGWKFGDCCDIIKRTYPLLMPYEELTADQKNMYLKYVTSVVSAILALGYKISQ